MIIAGFFALLIPSVASAAEVTRVGDIRAAVSFAQSKDWCTTSDAGSKADCTRQKTICDDGEWAEFVEDNVEFRGGVPFQKEGTGAVGVIGSVLNPIAGIAAHTAGGARITDGELLPDNVYMYLRKDVRNRSRIIPIIEASCFCACGANDTDIRCRGKNAGAPIPVSDGLFTREECMAACAAFGRKIADKCAGSLPIIEQTDIGSPQGQIAAASAEALANVNALCFTGEECTRQNGVWEAWDQCRDNKGRCSAKEPVITLNTPIGGTVKVQGLNTYVLTIFRYMISIVAVVTTVMFIYGAFLYLIGSSLTSITNGKTVMMDAIVGLLLVIGSATILRTLNPNLLRLDPLKIYMVNTVQFIQAAYCGELNDDLKLADAGEPPSLKSYEELAGVEGSFSVSPSRATCGHQFFVEGSVGQACAGEYCANANEACISCADGTIKECQGISGARKVCAKLTFGGTIDYADGRFPEEVYLIAVCGYAQGTLDATEDNIDIIEDVDLAKVARIAGTARTVEDVAGQASYQFSFSQLEIASAASACTESHPQNAFRGVLLGVQYNDDTDIGGRTIQALVTLRSANIHDDMAILSKGDCGGGTAPFSAYASGVGSDEGDFARAMQCGFARGRLMNTPADYWSVDELSRAARGERPITCNFNLTSDNAPSNPGEISGGRFCPDNAEGVWRID